MCTTRTVSEDADVSLTTCTVLSSIVDQPEYTDYTYLVIPATRASTRTAEIENVELWARRNNLSLNRSKTREVIFSDVRKKHKVEPPSPLPDITRDTSLKMLGVTITGNLSASDHIRGVVSDCSQTLYALRVLRSHGLGLCA